MRNAYTPHERNIFVQKTMIKWLLFLSLWFPTQLSAQSENTEPPYQRFPSLPPLQLLLGDSLTKFTKQDLPKKKAVLVMLFSPDCSHCQHTAEELPKFTKALKDVQIVMATMHGITQMNEFVKKYRLDELPNVVVGKDLYFLLPPFYAVKNFPFLAFYTRKGVLISVFEGSMPLDKVADVFSKAR